MKRLLIFISLVSSLLLLVACGGSSNGLAIEVTNTGSGDFEVGIGQTGDRVFCYADTGCETVTGATFAIPGEGYSMILDQSDPDREAVGAILTVVVDEGSGVVELVEGESWDDDGWEEFNVGGTIESAGTLSAGDEHTFTFGDVD